MQEIMLFYFKLHGSCLRQLLAQCINSLGFEECFFFHVLKRSLNIFFLKRDFTSVVGQCG